MQKIDHNIGFWEKRQFFDENFRKSQKIVITTHDPWSHGAITIHRYIHTYYQGYKTSLCKSRLKCSTILFGKTNTQLLPWKKVVQKFGILLKFKQNCPKENIRPIWSPYTIHTNKLYNQQWAVGGRFCFYVHMSNIFPVKASLSWALVVILIRFKL
jgi:hypothetical protein